MRATSLSAIVLATALLAGCASGPSKEVLARQPEQQLYQQAIDALNNGRYSSAVTQLETLDSRYPFGEHAQQTQLALMYAYYQISSWELVRSTATRYIRLHPNDPQADYAFYLRGLAAWEAGRFSLESLDLIDISKRDLGSSRDAYVDFSELARRYPNSQYAADARQRIIYLRNVLARHELQAADFYLRRKAYVAAVERGRWVIEHYPQTSANPDALAVMVEGYMGLGAKDRAQETLAILEHNKPDHPQVRNGIFHSRYVKGTLSLDN